MAVRYGTLIIILDVSKTNFTFLLYALCCVVCFTFFFLFGCRKMSRARAKRILLSVQSTNSQRLEEANEDITNPDNLLFLSNQFPNCYEDNYDDDHISHSNSSLLSNNQTHFEITQLELQNSPSLLDKQESQLPNSLQHIDDGSQIDVIIIPNDEENTITFDETQSYVIVPTNQPELGNSPSLLDQQEPQLPNNLQNIDDGSQISFIVLSNDEGSTTNNITLEYINQYADKDFNVSMPPQNDEVITTNALDVIEPTSSSLNNVAKLVDYSDSTDSEPEEPVVKRKKRCQVKKSEWNVEKNRLNREKGNKYYGKKKQSGKWIKDIPKEKKELKPRCKCSEQKNGVIKCHMITEEDRKSLFDQFWMMNWGEKKLFIKCLIKVMPIKRQRDRKDPSTSQRKNTMVYYLKKNDDMIRVCKTLFLNTFSINNFLCWSWKSEDTVTETIENPPAPTQSTQPRTATNAEKEYLEKFLNDLPKLPSHYCRKRTSLLYLQPDIISKQQLYKLYKEECNSKTVKPLSIATFSNTLALKKIALFKPKKDLCETCNGFALGHISEDVYNEHTQKKIEARVEKDKDKQNKKFVFTADLQAVLMAPRSNVSSNYYKTKLCVHNWCIYDLKTGEGYCFLWNEAEGGLTSEEFATIMSRFIIKEVLPRMDESDRELTFYTDGCTYQNRNTTVSNAMTNIALYHNVTITQKYLEVGHTQMEVDSMHAMIEKRLKNQIIHVPAEYINVCRTAKSNNTRYKCEYLTFDYFKDFKQVAFYKSIRPGKLKGDPKVKNFFLLLSLGT